MSVKVLLIQKVLEVQIISPQRYLKSERLRGFKNTFFRTAFKVYLYMILIMLFYA